MGPLGAFFSKHVIDGVVGGPGPGVDALVVGLVGDLAVGDIRVAPVEEGFFAAPAGDVDEDLGHGFACGIDKAKGDGLAGLELQVFGVGFGAELDLFEQGRVAWGDDGELGLAGQERGEAEAA